MSLIRALSKDLAARTDDSLRALFAARPDLISPGVPDFAALAARASARVSVQRALERLTRPQMQVLETLHLCTNTDTGHSASAAVLRKLITGSTAAAVDGILATLQGLALVHRAAAPSGTPAATAKQRFYLPVGSPEGRGGDLPGRARPELHGAGPAPARVRAARRPAGSELHRSGADIHDATTPMEAALALQHWTSSPEGLRQILAGAPERTTALLARFRNWAMGAVPQAQRKASITTEGPDVGPVDWLLARGLLVPLDAAHVELPHSVGTSLRGGVVIDDFSLTPPRPELGWTTAALRRNAALSAISETLRLVGELLHAVGDQPLATLRSGGVGVRETRRLSETPAPGPDPGGGAAGTVRAGGPDPAGRGHQFLGPPGGSRMAPPAPAGTMVVAGQRLAGQRAGAVPGGPARLRSRNRPPLPRAAEPSWRSPPRRSGPTPRWSANGSWKF